MTRVIRYGPKALGSENEQLELENSVEISQWIRL